MPNAKKSLFLALHSCSLFLAGPLVSAAVTECPPFNDNIVFPEDAGVINVKQRGAKGDGVTDDTAAIQAAFNSTGLIYFPDGTYLVSGAFEPPKRKGKVPSRRTLQGQSMERTIIKLKDNTPAFRDAEKPLGLFKISYAPEQAFRNGVRNLTIDTGKGNPGAIGLQYYASNQGGMHHVTIRSGDGQGRIGLDLNFSHCNGPLLVKDIRVSGFDIGIDGGSGHLCTFEHVRVENQNKMGFFSSSYAYVRGFTSIQKNPIPAVMTRGHSLVTLIDASAQGQGNAAIVAEGTSVLVRNFQTTGYDNAIKRGATEIKGPDVAEWTAQPVLSNFLSPPHSLNLPIKETPEVPWDDPKTWTSVLKFAAPRDMTKKKREPFDITEAFQKAIDSGATTIYFPRIGASSDLDEYHLLGTVYVRGNVRRIIGCESEFRQPLGAIDNVNEAEYDAQIGKEAISKIVIDKGAAPVVVIERFDWNYGRVKIENRGPSTLVLSSLIGNVALASGAGDLFLEDTITTYLDINGQNVWSRQLNAERGVVLKKENGVVLPGQSGRPSIRQNGGSLWLHGLKNEGNRTKIVVKNGQAEISAFVLANKTPNPFPMFESIDSRLSVSFCEDVLRNAPFDIAFRETRGGVTREIKHADVPRDGQGKFVSLYVADPGAGSTPPVAPQNFVAKAETTSSVALSWDAAANAEGYSIEQQDGENWKSVRLARADETNVKLSGLTLATAYQFRVVAFNGKGSATSKPVSVTTLSPPPPGTGTGLRAEYYGNKYFAEFKETRLDPQIAFDWSAAPPAGLKAGDFAARWTGFLEPRFSEEYTFSVPSEGARLWLGNELVLNATKRTRKVTVPLEAGKKLPLKFEFFGDKGSSAHLSWQSTSQPNEPIATTQLYPAAEALPALTFSAAKTRVTEGENVTVTLESTGLPQPVELVYSVSGDAVAGEDYKALPGKLTLAAGKAKIGIDVQTIDDKIGEPEKSLTLTLPQSAAYNVNGPPVSLQLRDNDLPPAANGTGLSGEYFAQPDFTAPKGRKLDKSIDFKWDKKAPHPDLDPKGYSIRWTGQLQPLFSETYTLSANATSYGGARVWIDEALVFDSTTKGGQKQGEVALKAGQKHNIKVEFINKKFYGSQMSLLWRSPSQFSQTIPTSQLFPTP